MKIAGTRIPVWLFIVYILSLLAVLAWPLTAFASVFAFDAPGSENQPGTYVAVGVALCYPIVPLAGVAGSFFAYKRDRKALAYMLAGLAAVPFALMAAGILYSSILSIVIALGGKL